MKNDINVEDAMKQWTSSERITSLLALLKMMDADFETSNIYQHILLNSVGEGLIN